MDIEPLARETVNCAYKLYRDLGPGLLESVYETALASLLEQQGFQVERQKIVSFVYNGKTFDEGFRADLLIDGQLLVELKSVEKLAMVHGKQVLTYLRLMHLPLGLLINFGAATFKDCVQRIVNGHTNFASSQLRIHNT